MAPSTSAPAREDVEYEPLMADPEQAAEAEGDATRAGVRKPEALQMEEEEKEHPLDGIGMALAYAATFAFVVTTWAVLLLSNPLSLGWFFWHPLLVSSAIGLFVHGILTLQPTSQAQPAEKTAGLTRHQLYMFALGFPMLLFGVAAVAFNKHLHGAAHITSSHAMFGVLTLGWMIVQIFLGAGSVWANGRLFGGNPRAKLVWKYHRLSGYVLFALLMATAHLGGAWSHFAETREAWPVRLLVYTAAPLLMAAGVYARIRPSKMRFF